MHLRHTWSEIAPYAGILVVLTVTGCASPWTGEPKNEFVEKNKAVREILESEEHPVLISEVAVPFGLNRRAFESFGLITKLAGTGGDTRPSSQRDFLLNEMRARDVDNPNALLQSKETAMVKVKTIAYPGALKGQRVDTLVKISTESEATSLQNGFLLEASLQEIALLGGKTRKGNEKAKAEGPIVILPPSLSEQGVDYKTGLILGGARLLDTRVLGINIREDFSHVNTSNEISKAINARFYQSTSSNRRGIAIPKNDGFVQIDLHSKYRWDPSHFMDVILALAFLETSEQRQQRINDLAGMIREPTTARNACNQLEALGKEGTSVLVSTLQSPNPEIRFYAAYALAYLDDIHSVPVLVQLAERYPEFRSLALIGLTAIEHFAARDALERMLQNPEPEVRYGALLSLRRRPDGDSIIQPVAIGKVTALIEIPSPVSLVTVSLEERPEIAIFGGNLPIAISEYMEINNHLVVRPEAMGMVKITKFNQRGPDNSVIVPLDMRSVIEGLVKVGGTYSDIAWMLDECQRRGWMRCPVAFNPRPFAGRIHERIDSDIEDDDESTILADDPDEVSAPKPVEKHWWSFLRRSNEKS